ncbi:MAG: nucleoside-diphosphate kinase [Clostridia bacterium]|nr:nucleoside-diphosphate kinase [Clostridia bacterium]
MINLKKERTFVILKPDAIQRSLIGETIKRFEATGLKLVAMKFVMADEKILWEHYNKDDVWFQKKGEITIKNRLDMGLPVDKTAIEYGKDIIRGLVKFMSCGPVVQMIWEGNKAIGIVKKLVGGTEPTSSDVGTIRGDLTLDSYELANYDARAVRNLVHCSDEPNEAKREISLWFQDEEIIDYRLVAESILYDVNLDGIRE